MKAGASSGTRNVPCTNDSAPDEPATAVTGTPCAAAERKRNGGKEPGHHHHELHQIDPGRAEKSTGDEVREHQHAADNGSDPARLSRDDLEHRGDANQLCRQHEHRDAPEYERGYETYGRRIAKLEIVAQRQEAMRAGFAPQSRSDPPGENQRPETSRPVPPPRAPANLITKTGGTDRRSRANVGREHRCEHEQAPTSPRPATKKLPLLRTSRPTSESKRNEACRIHQEQGEVLVHLSASLSRSARAWSVRQIAQCGNTASCRGLTDGPYDGQCGDVGGQGTHNQHIVFLRAAAGGEREDGVAVERRMDRGNGARQTILRHLRDLGGLRFGQRRIGRDDDQRRILASGTGDSGVRAQYLAGIRQSSSVGGP